MGELPRKKPLVLQVSWIFVFLSERENRDFNFCPHLKQNVLINESKRRCFLLLLDKSNATYYPTKFG